MQFYHHRLMLYPDDFRFFHILENDLILKHDSIWPRGLNRMLHLTTCVEVSELRNSCLRHRWPFASDVAAQDTVTKDIDLTVLRKRLQSAPTSPAAPVTSAMKDPSVAKPPSTVAKSAEKTPQSSVKCPASTNGIDGSASTSPPQRQIGSASNTPARPRSARGTGNQAHQQNSGHPSTARGRPASAPKPVVSPTASHPPPSARTSVGLPSVSTQARPHSASTSTSGIK